MTPEAMFEHSWPWLCASMLRYGKTHNKEDIWREIAEGRAQLHPLPHAAMLTTIEQYPAGLKEIKGWLAGGDLREIVAYEPVLAAWGKEIGCTRASIVGRRGWMKAMPGYFENGVILTKDL